MEPKHILRTPEAAARLGLAASTLEKLRVYGGGPEYIKLGRRAVGYTIEALDRWIEDRRRLSTSDEGRQAA